MAYDKSKFTKHIYCSHGCRMKYLHNQTDKVKYCEVCKCEVKHIIGIGCIGCYNRSESHKQSIVNTIQTRYGEDYINSSQIPIIKDRIKANSQLKYGTDNPGNNRDARIKANMTMRGNGNGSSMEDRFELLLINHQISYKTQYKSELYPYFCDFYLDDLDLYIELNGYWSHGNHKFDKNNEDDLKILDNWKNKANNGHKQYNNAINVWTNTDLKKYECAKINNLNYLVLWNDDDINNFFNQKISTLLR